MMAAILRMDAVGGDIGLVIKSVSNKDTFIA